ncbi:isochorismate synthase [Crinalium epipsammum PCC 9333]|uniref:isochorismate synthase n=1 Tax=Crinalium epipsammum PCC 9333 TaxID=1173022 RepID=K9W4F1_9CYAN|nr:isochorismate synthase [Crinalium epipsammum]AFZ14674.1 isochorismate synthase [Crinalium epipsammum PCC 9333]
MINKMQTSLLNFSAMTVTPYRNPQLIECKDLYQFLSACKQTAQQKDQTKIISISLEMPPVDPLAVMAAMAKPGQLNFYFEQAGHEVAIAAIDAVVSLKVAGSSRFEQAQHFIKSCFSSTMIAGADDLALTGPHFFCNFTFFDEPLNGDLTFPPATIFLPRLQFSKYKNKGILVLNIEINQLKNHEFLFKEILSKIEIIKNSSQIKSNHIYNSLENYCNLSFNNINKFKSSVTSALESIRCNKLNKIVLAHAVDVKSPAPFKIIDSLDNLRQRYPGCYIFSTSNSKGQTFIGASPERLISIKNQQLFTDSLAGSAPRGTTAIEDAEFGDRLLSSEKERREHLVVLDFITQRLTKLGLAPVSPQLPQLLKLANIQHLWTPIQARMPSCVHPLEIVAELHPTPAVAGLPRKIACQQIRTFELFERSLYAAPIGWVDHQGNSEFIVGIRSALIDGDRARLYAGAGIVAGSEPDKELAEIQLKLQALLKALV